MALLTDRLFLIHWGFPSNITTQFDIPYMMANDGFDYKQTIEPLRLQTHKLAWQKDTRAPTCTNLKVHSLILYPCPSLLIVACMYGHDNRPSLVDIKYSISIKQVRISRVS
jgi:hypothetical protein